MVYIDGLSSFIGPIDEDAATEPFVLTSTKLDHASQIISDAIKRIKSSFPSCAIELVLDTPSILLQSTIPPISALQLSNWLLDIREEISSTVVSLPADWAFVKAASSDDASGNFTPMESEIAAFVLGLLHQSRAVMSCRPLDTGWAEDVSGVLRCTRGSGRDSETLEDGEWLYHISGDGSAKVWSRGAG